MLFKLIVIFYYNLIIFGGGFVYIPFYENFYVDLFKLTTYDNYYTIVAIQNVLPGVTGGKLASYAMFLDYGFIGLFLAMLVFIIPSVLLVSFISKKLTNIKDKPLFVYVSNNIKNVIVGVLLALSIDLIKITYDNMKLSLFLFYICITSFLLLKCKISIFKLIIISIIVQYLIIIYVRGV